MVRIFHIIDNFLHSVVVKRDPFEDKMSGFHPFQLEMERNLRDLHNKFGEYFGDNEFPSCSTGWIYSKRFIQIQTFLCLIYLDIKENKDNFEIHVDLPGVKKENIKLSIKDNVLRMEGERKYEHTESKPSEDAEDDDEEKSMEI